MAMTKCKECKAEVSSKAKKCPNCGVSNPGVGGKDLAVGLGAIIVLILFTVVACAPDDETAEESAPEEPRLSDQEKAAADKAEMEACREDLQCWGEENWSMAEVICEEEIERLANYEVKWTDSFTSPKLGRRGWLDKDSGTLSYYGDKVQFSNGYGAFQNYIYRCDYDPSSESVINVEVEPGRL